MRGLTAACIQKSRQNGRADADANAIPDHQNGHKSGFWQGIECRHQRVYRCVGKAGRADYKAQQHAHDNGNAKTGHDDPTSAPGMTQNVVFVFSSLGGNAQRAGEYELRHLEHRANQLPQGDDDDDE